MKAFPTLAAIISTLVLSACQQAYIDKAARASSSGPPAAQLSAPSIDLQKISFPNYPYSGSTPVWLDPSKAQASDMAATKYRRVDDLRLQSDLYGYWQCFINSCC